MSMDLTDLELTAEAIKKASMLSTNEHKRFKVISADIPWSYNDKKMNRGGAARYYDTMTIEQIKSINVADVADDDCLLMLWATAPLLPEALDVINAWGFKYKTVGFVWVKRSANYWTNLAKRLRRDFSTYYNLFKEVDEGSPFSPESLKAWFGTDWIKSVTTEKAPYNVGMGSYTRANAEFVLFAVKGKGATLIEDHSISQIIDSCKMEHSRKPDEYLETVESLTFSCSKFEMFARRRREGWEVLGNQVDTDYLLDEHYKLVRLSERVNVNHKPTGRPYVRKNPIKIEELKTA
jgi:N6-adenosine-specific RNA methylase IME4